MQLKALIYNKGIPKNQIADRMNISRQRLHKLIGRPHLIRIKQAEQLSDATGISLYKIIRVILKSS